MQESLERIGFMLDRWLCWETQRSLFHVLLKVLKSRPFQVGPMIQQMWDQEKHHLATFDKLIPEHRARPTALLPFWNMAGFALGAGTALLGKEGAMACTVAVEASITEHYNDQIRELTSLDNEEHRELIATISKFRDEEQEHHDIGLENDAELAPAYQLLSGSIKVTKLQSMIVFSFQNNYLTYISRTRS